MTPSKFARTALAALVLLSGCSLFESQATRREKAYDKYLSKSLRAKEHRVKASAARGPVTIPNTAPPEEQRPAIQSQGDGAAPPPQSAPPAPADTVPAPPQGQ